MECVPHWGRRGCRQRRGAGSALQGEGGYPERNVAAGWPVRGPVRVCRSRCAPSIVRRIRCFLSIHLPATQVRAGSTNALNALEIASPYQERSP
jgi:hypothetical protein